MPTSPPGSERGRGFTLIELLVTLLIMGLLAGLASLSIGGGAHRAARDEAERLYQLLAFASDEATLQGEEYGLVVEDDGYRVLRFDPATEAWAEATGKPWEPHALPAGMRLELSLAEAPGARRRDARDGADGEPVPEILLLSSGEVTPFRIDIRLGEGTEPAARIESDGSGTIRQE